MPVQVSKIVKRLSRTFPARLSAFAQVKSLIDEFGEAAGSNDEQIQHAADPGIGLRRDSSGRYRPHR